MIQAICSTLNLSPMQVMWDISWPNVMLMYKDAQRTDCKSRSEAKTPQAKMPDVIDLNKPQDVEKLCQIFR